MPHCTPKKKKVECGDIYIFMQIHVCVCANMVHMPDRYYDYLLENKTILSQMGNTKSGDFFPTRMQPSSNSHCAFHNTDSIVIQCFQTPMISHMCFSECAEPDTTASAH